MQKGLILALLLILALGTGTLAAEIKVGGEVEYSSETPVGDGVAAHDGDQYLLFKLAADAALSEQTKAKLALQFRQFAPGKSLTLCTTALVQTKLDGLGTLSAGRNPDYGTNPFAWHEDSLVTNCVWGDWNRDTLAIAFTSEESHGFAGQIIFNPWSQEFGTTETAGELTYDLPVLAGSTVGVAFNKTSYGSSGEENTDWALIGNILLNENISVYGEVGQVDGANNLNDKAFGTRVKVGAATLVAEAFLDNASGSGYYLQADYPFQEITLSASYRCGDVWYDTFDGLLRLSAKVEF